MLPQDLCLVCYQSIDFQMRIVSHTILLFLSLNGTFMWSKHMRQGQYVDVTHSSHVGQVYL